MSRTLYSVFPALLCALVLVPQIGEAASGAATNSHAPLGKPDATRSADAMSVFARIRLAQADRSGPGNPQESSQERQGSPQNAGGNVDEIRQASQTKVGIPQPAGSFPTNEMSNQPVIALGAGEDGLKKDVGALQQTLTELQQLKLQTKQAHWNASGTLYYPLHLLLQEHYEGLAKYSDTIAERLLAIGASADGRATTVVKTSGIPEIPGGFLDDAQILVWFTNAYKRAGEEVNAAIRATEKVDPTTSNLLQEVEHGLAKYQWQMRAQLQQTHTDPNTGWNINNNKAIDLSGTGSTAR